MHGTLGAANVVIDGGALTATGSILGNLLLGTSTSPATLDLGGTSANLNIAGTYTQGGNGNLNIDLTPSGFDRLLASGNLSLDGSLFITSTYTPGTSMVFSILDSTGGTRGSSLFDNVVLPGTGWSLSYLSNGVDLVYSSPIPEPAPWWFISLGLVCIFLGAWRRAARKAQWRASGPFFQKRCSANR